MSGYECDTNFPLYNRERPLLPRKIDLYGRAPDGHAMLWKRGVPVSPVAAFEHLGRWIKGGHYVIDHNGDAIVVHCANMDDGGVSVQFMHNESSPYALPCRMIESMLLGKVATAVRKLLALGANRTHTLVMTPSVPSLPQMTEIRSNGPSS